jgi:hypothetical protein
MNLINSLRSWFSPNPLYQCDAIECPYIASFKMTVRYGDDSGYENMICCEQHVIKFLDIIIYDTVKKVEINRI